MIVKAEKLSEKERVDFDLGNCVIIESEIGEEVIMKVFELNEVSLEPMVRIIFNSTAGFEIINNKERFFRNESFKSRRKENGLI